MKISSEFNAALAKARSLSAAGKYSQAVTLYSDLLSSGKERENLLRELVQLYLKLQEVDKAINCVEQLIQIAPEHWDYYLSGATLSEKTGRLDKSIGFYKAVLKQNPDLPNAQYNFARLLKKVGRYQEAIGAYRQALKYGISDPEEVHSNLAIIYSELHKEEDAFTELEQALTINPNYIPALFNRAGLEEERGRKEEAEALYRHILALRADYYPSLSRLANMVEVTSSDDPVIGQLKSALRNRSVRPLEREELWFALGKVLDDCGDYDAAFQAYSSANHIGRARFQEYRKDLQEKLVTDLMETFDSTWSSSHFEVADFSPIFICGMLRSGSTLLERVLSGHSQITAGGELEYIPKLVRQLGNKYPRSLKKLGVKYLKNVAQGYRCFVRERLGNPEYFTDKRPDNFLHVGLIKTLFPGAKIIWTRRNLLDNCLSIYFQQLGAGMNYSVDLDSIGHYYQQNVRLMEYWKFLFPGSICEIGYEDFVRSPKKELERILGFIGLYWEDSCLDFAGGEGLVKTASIWQVRKPLYKKSSGRYKNYEKHLRSLQKYI